MREVRIIIACDWCKEEVSEDDVAPVQVTVRSQTYEGDACLTCARGMTQEMRPVKKRRTRKVTS